MKNLIIYFSLLAFSFNLFSQSAYEDAIKLSEYLISLNFQKTVAQFDPARDTAIMENALPILYNYTSDPEDMEDIADLNDAFDGNPFISGDQGTSKILLPNVFQSPALLVGSMLSASEAAPSTSGPSVTNIADGLAKFLVKRTKEELTITFFRRLKQKINDNIYLKTVFPKTSELLFMIDAEIYQFNAYLENLREQFVKDMKTLPINLKTALNDGNLIKKPAEKIIVDDMLEIAQLVLDKEPPFAMLQYLGGDYDGLAPALLNTTLIDSLPEDLKPKFKNAASGFKVANLLSESLKSNNGSNTWVKPKELSQLFKNKETFYVYLGLLWQRAEGIEFSDGKSVRDILDTTATTAKFLEDLKTQLETFVQLAQEATISLDSIKAKQLRNVEIAYNDYYQFFYSSFSLLKTGIRFKENYFSGSVADVTWDDKIIDLLKHFNELNLNIRQRHYAAGVTNLAYVFEIILDDKFTFKKDLLKYGNFIAIVAEADNSDQVAAAIEAVALPVGGSITKKYSSFSVAINAYTGFAVGSEILDSLGTQTFMAVAAPVGISFNTGFGRKGSFGLYTSIIDVGALASFRFGDSMTDDLPDLSFKNILAPGGYAIYGFGGDIPLTVGFGAQLGPNLRAIKGSDGVFDEGWRWGAFISVDIPLFNLYVR